MECNKNEYPIFGALSSDVDKSTPDEARLGGGDGDLNASNVSKFHITNSINQSISHAFCSFQSIIYLLIYTYIYASRFVNSV